jgi:opacity protein-like surface antigen
VQFKTMVLTTASFTILSSGLAHATDAFVGPSIALGLVTGNNQNGLQTSKTFRDEATALGAKPVTSPQASKTSVLPILDLSYGFPLANQWVGTVGMSYDIGKLNFGRGSLAQMGNDSANLDLTLKDHLSVYLAPGMRMGSEWLVYGKLGYHSAISNYRFSRTDNDTSASGTDRLSGLGIGAGANWAIAKKLELRMEVEYIRFNGYDFKAEAQSPSLATIKPSMTRANVLLGYRF